VKTSVKMRSLPGGGTLPGAGSCVMRSQPDMKSDRIMTIKPSVVYNDFISFSVDIAIMLDYYN